MSLLHICWQGTHPGLIHFNRHSNTSYTFAQPSVTGSIMFLSYSSVMLPCIRHWVSVKVVNTISKVGPDFHQTFANDALPGRNERFTFWVRGQSSRSRWMLQTTLYGRRYTVGCRRLVSCWVSSIVKVFQCFKWIRRRVICMFNGNYLRHEPEGIAIGHVIDDVTWSVECGWRCTRLAEVSLSDCFFQYLLLFIVLFVHL